MGQRRCQVLTVALLLPATLLLASCGGSDSGRYEAVPGAVWQAMPGVKVLHIDSYSGNSCCESYPGGLSVTLKLPNRQPVRTLRNGLTANGWHIRSCPGEPRTLYFTQPSYWGSTHLPRHLDDSNIDVAIRRASGPESDFAPTGC